MRVGKSAEKYLFVKRSSFSTIFQSYHKGRFFSTLSYIYVFTKQKFEREEVDWMEAGEFNLIQIYSGTRSVIRISGL